MKRTFVLLFFGVILSLGLAACGGGAPPDSAAPEPTEEPHPAPLPEETSAPVDEPEPTDDDAPSAVLPTDAEGAQGGPDQTPIPAAALPERRLLSLEWPQRIRVGDTDTIRLTLEMDESGQITSTAEISGNEVTMKPVIVENLYETHTIQVEARLNLAGMNVQPEGLLVEQLNPGNSVTMYWSLSPDKAGEHRGSFTVQLAMIPKGTGVAERRQILARTLEIESVSVIGMSAGAARWTGFAGSALGFIFSVPFFERILDWFWRRIRRMPAC